ncbi:MAG: hypothetical protein JWQ54_4676 [Mucilaginibacter sp.]|nr:hypothetical protein [Mucilaginibacter sp.]
MLFLYPFCFTPDQTNLYCKKVCIGFVPCLARVEILIKSLW